MLKKQKDTSVLPDVRADEPERAMEQFTDGLRRVLSARKQPLGISHQKPKLALKKRPT